MSQFFTTRFQEEDMEIRAKESGIPRFDLIDSGTGKKPVCKNGSEFLIDYCVKASKVKIRNDGMLDWLYEALMWFVGHKTERQKVKEAVLSCDSFLEEMKKNGKSRFIITVKKEQAPTNQLFIKSSSAGMISEHPQGKTVLWYKGGGKYFGEVENNKRNGYGVFINANGAEYEGVWNNNKPVPKELFEVRFNSGVYKGCLDDKFSPAGELREYSLIFYEKVNVIKKRWRELKEKHVEKKENEYGWKILKSYDFKEGKIDYFFDGVTKTPHIAIGLCKKVYPVQEGAFKELIGANKNYFLLRLRENRHHRNFTPKVQKKFRVSITRLREKGVKCLVPAYFISNGRMVTKRGDCSLTDILDGGVCKIEKFENLIKGLSVLHANDAIHGDIKTCNVIYFEKRKEFYFIDLDSLLWVDKNQNQIKFGGLDYARGTPAFITSDFVKFMNTLRKKSVDSNINNQEPDLAKVIEEFKSMDNYAAILMLILATDKSLRKVIFNNEGYSNHGILSRKTLNKKDRLNFIKWIETHVNEEFRQSVYKFLHQPAKYQLPAALHSVIQWSLPKSRA